MVLFEGSEYNSLYRSISGLKYSVTTATTVLCVVALVLLHNCIKDKPELDSNIKDMYRVATAYILYQLSFILQLLNNETSNAIFLAANVIWTVAIFGSQLILYCVFVKFTTLTNEAYFCNKLYRTVYPATMSKRNK